GTGAAMKLSASREAVFLIVPMLGAAVVWATFLLGRQLDTSIVGLVAALMTACSATFLFQLIQPMSDVPVTAWWLFAAACVFRRLRPAPLLAGLACSAAVVTRPNLVLLILVFVPFVCDRAALPRFLAGALPGPIA